MDIQVYHIVVILHIFETLSLLSYLSWWSVINNPTIFDVTIILWLAEGSDDGYHFVPTKLFLIKKKNSAFHWFLNSFGMKSKFLSITNNSPYDLVSAYLLCSVFRLSWSHLPPSQVPCAPVTWKDPHVQTRHTSPISMPLCTVPFYKVGPPPLSTSPMAHVMELLFLSACLSPSGLWIPWKPEWWHHFCPQRPL